MVIYYKDQTMNNIEGSLLLSGFVYAYHPVVPRSNPKHTIYGFSIYSQKNFIGHLSLCREKDESKEKEVGWPIMKTIINVHNLNSQMALCIHSPPIFATPWQPWGHHKSSLSRHIATQSRNYYDFCQLIRSQNIVLFVDVTCVGHWPKFSSDNVRILASAAAKSSTTEAYQLVRNSTDSNKPIPILPPTPTNLIVQDRTGLARCLQFSKIPGEERLKLSVKMFESECIEQNFEQNLMSQALLTFQGACQEALTDVSSISGATECSKICSKFEFLVLVLISLVSALQSVDVL